jgi:hypothetical protein
LFYTATAEGSFLLPDWIQGAYWIVAALVLGFLVIWSLEGVVGRRMRGREGVLDRGVTFFVGLAREGFAVVVEGSIRLWGRLLEVVGHGPAGGVQEKRNRWASRLVKLLIFGAVAAVGGLVQLIANPPLLTILYVAAIMLYAIVIGLALVGGLRRGQARG